MPVLGRDLDHVVDPGVVLERHLSKPEVGALAGVSGHDVVDHAAAVRLRDIRQPSEGLFVAEHRIDLRGDPVEMPIDARGLAPSDDPARTLDRARVHGVDAHALERVPEVRLPERIEERLARPGDERDGIGGEPDIRGVDRAPRVGARVGIAPHAGLAGQLTAEHVGVFQHRLADQPLDVGGVGRGRGARVDRHAADVAAAELIAWAEPAGARGIALLVVRDLRQRVHRRRRVVGRHPRQVRGRPGDRRGVLRRDDLGDARHGFVHRLPPRASTNGCASRYAPLRARQDRVAGARRC